MNAYSRGATLIDMLIASLIASIIAVALFSFITQSRTQMFRASQTLSDYKAAQSVVDRIDMLVQNANASGCLLDDLSPRIYLTNATDTDAPNQAVGFVLNIFTISRQQDFALQRSGSDFLVESSAPIAPGTLLVSSNCEHEPITVPNQDSTARNDGTYAINFVGCGPLIKANCILLDENTMPAELFQVAWYRWYMRGAAEQLYGQSTNRVTEPRWRSYALSEHASAGLVIESSTSDEITLRLSLGEADIHYVIDTTI